MPDMQRGHVMTARTADLVLGAGLLASAGLVIYAFAVILGLAMPY
jgi:hypothetical protein